MPVSMKDIRPGDTLLTSAGEIYTYLGYYQGEPVSIYKRPDEGYLYMFAGRRPDLDKIQDSGEKDHYIKQNVQQRNLSVSIDGHACYTKAPKNFIYNMHHTDLEGIEFVFDLKRIDDKKPMRKDKNLRNLKPGDCMIGSGNELYVYMGEYQGQANIHVIDTPDEGHMYIRVTCVREDNNWQDQVLADIDIKRKWNMIGFGHYTKQPKKFTRFFGHVNLWPVWDNTKTLWGTTRKPGQRAE